MVFPPPPPTPPSPITFIYSFVFTGEKKNNGIDFDLLIFFNVHFLFFGSFFFIFRFKTKQNETIFVFFWKFFKRKFISFSQNNDDVLWWPIIIIIIKRWWCRLSLSLSRFDQWKKTMVIMIIFFHIVLSFFFSYSSIWNTHEKTTTTTINYLGGENRFSSPIYQPTNKPPSHKWILWTTKQNDEWIEWMKKNWWKIFEIIIKKTI